MTEIVPIHKDGVLYTIDTNERDRFLGLPGRTWVDEGTAWHAFADNSIPGLSPVHRFYSPTRKAYFYTILASETQHLIEDYTEQWQYQGKAFYAFPDGQQPPGTSPVYRFWSVNLGYHLFTIDEAEKNTLRTRYSNVWTYEGIAWSAYR